MVSILNWSIYYRLATLVSGVIMLIIPPIIIGQIELAQFYILYTISGMQGFIDAGLTYIIFIKGYKELNLEEKIQIKISLSIRIICIIVLINLWGYISKYFDIININIKFLLFFSFIVSLNYLSICALNYIEGNISKELAYKVKFYSELMGALLLLFGLLLFNEYGIIGLLVGRSIIPLIIIIMKNYTTNKKIDTVIENNFQLKLFIVGFFGYASSMGLGNIISFIYDANIVNAFFQSYFICSTVFSIVMSYMLYMQSDIKHIIKNNNEVVDFKINITKLLSIIYIIGIIIVYILCYCIDLYFNFIKYDAIVFIFVALTFVPLINNNISAIIFRMSGRENTFYISLIAPITMLTLLYLSSFFYGFIFFLIGSMVNSLIFNYFYTNKIFNKKYNR